MYTKTRKTFFLPQKGDGHCRQAAKESRLGATLAGKHEVGVTQKELDRSGLFQIGTKKNVVEAKGCLLRGKAIDRGHEKKGAML